MQRLTGNGRAFARVDALAASRIGACALAALATFASLGGCAGAGRAASSTPASASAAAAADVPQLRLAPAALGRTLALQQRIDVRAPGHAQALDVMLEADARRVRLAVLAMGQVAARLDWDGVTLDESRAPWWPPQVSGARILSDLQLAEWPAAAVRAALPAGWRLDEEGDVRTLSQGAEVVTTVTRRADGVVEIAQRRAPYALTIASHPLEQVSDAGEGSGR